MTRLVVDASVIVKLFLNEAGSQETTAAVKKAATLLAPDLLWTEVGNILWKYVRRGDLTASEADQILSDMLQLPIQITPSRDLIRSALSIATATDRTVYDALYIALAVQSQGVVLTADERLVNALATTRWGPFVRSPG